MELYIHSPIRFHGVLLNSLSIRKTLTLCYLHPEDGDSILLRNIVIHLRPVMPTMKCPEITYEERKDKI
jgi:hypothetical protein